jgi:hypothetical protein
MTTIEKSIKETPDAHLLMTFIHSKAKTKSEKEIKKLIEQELKYRGIIE